MSQIESIPSIVNGCLDLLALESSVDMSYLLTDSNPIGMIRTRCRDVLKYLNYTNRAIQRVNKFELNGQSDINWIYNGRREIFTIFKSLGVLDYMLGQINDKFDVELNDEFRCELNEIKELNMKLKILINGLQSKMEVANQYYEINECVLKSIDDELENFQMNFRNLENDLRDINCQQGGMDNMEFNEIRMKLRECELFSLNRSIKFVPLNKEELVVFNKFIDLEKRLNHSIAALKYVPNTIEMFLNNAKQVYPNEVLEFVERYTTMVKNVSSLRAQLDQFQNGFITKRMNEVFQLILELISGVMGDEKMRADVMEMISVLNSIKDICCIDGEQRQRFGLISSRFASADEVINYRPQSRLNRRVFSNPNSSEIITQSNMNISDEFNEEIKLIEMIRLEANELSRELESSNRIRDLNMSLSNLEIPRSPSSKYTPQHASNLSSPDQVRVRDIFDTDPFVTPGTSWKRGARTSKIPMLSPSTTSPKSPIAFKTPTSGLTTLLNFKESKVIERKGVRQSQIPLPTRPESIQDIMQARRRTPRKPVVFKMESRQVLEQRASEAISIPKRRSNGYRITTL